MRLCITSTIASNRRTAASVHRSMFPADHTATSLGRPNQRHRPNVTTIHSFIAMRIIVVIQFVDASFALYFSFTFIHYFNML